MKDKNENEFFELHGSETKQNNCNCCLSTVSRLVVSSFNYNHRRFLHLADAVRKFFHSRVATNAENDVIKFQPETLTRIYAILAIVSHSNRSLKEQRPKSSRRRCTLSSCLNSPGHNSAANWRWKSLYLTSTLFNDVSNPKRTKRFNFAMCESIEESITKVCFSATWFGEVLAIKLRIEFQDRIFRSRTSTSKLVSLSENLGLTLSMPLNSKHQKSFVSLANDKRAT